MMKETEAGIETNKISLIKLIRDATREHNGSPMDLLTAKRFVERALYAESFDSDMHERLERVLAVASSDPTFRDWLAGEIETRRFMAVRALRPKMPDPDTSR